MIIYTGIQYHDGKYACICKYETGNGPVNMMIANTACEHDKIHMKKIQTNFIKIIIHTTCTILDILVQTMESY